MTSATRPSFFASRRRLLILSAAAAAILIVILVPVLVTQLRNDTSSANNAAVVPSTSTSTTTTSSAPAAATTTSPVSIKNLPPNAKFDYQIGGSYQPDADVQIVSRDRTSEPVAGLYNICYINAFQSQPDSADWWKREGRDELLLRKKTNGDYFGDDAWAGEIFLDTRTADKRAKLAEIINGWIDECAAKGFDAIEPDNLDTFTRADDLLTRENNLALAKLFTDHAHSVGIAVGQKNTAELEDSGRKDVGFDFAIIESCQVYGECEMYTDYYGDKALEIEYTDEENYVANFKKACKARGKNISVILRDRMVATKDLKDYHYEAC